MDYSEYGKQSVLKVERGKHSMRSMSRVIEIEVMISRRYTCTVYKFGCVKTALFFKQKINYCVL